jgi:hypothetical protein
MYLITVPHNPPISIAWNPVSAGDRLQEIMENYPSKTYDGLAMQIQKSMTELSGSDMILVILP